MRNEPLLGYLLHQRPYQEKRALYYLFSYQHGIVHGVGKKGAPLFEPLQLFATGRRDLKTFSQITISQVHTDIIDDDITANDESNPSLEKTAEMISRLRYQQISGQQQYAALYLNEILWKLLPAEDPMPVLWQHYQNSLLTLKQSLNADELKLCLRQFEQHLFKELGFAPTLAQDTSDDAIETDTIYRFLPDVGFMPVIHDVESTSSTQAVFNGQELLSMLQLGIADSTLDNWSRLHKQIIDQLLDYQPLQSRLLWQQQQRYQ